MGRLLCRLGLHAWDWYGSLDRICSRCGLLRRR